jgi:hypothetical protein
MAKSVNIHTFYKGGEKSGHCPVEMGEGIKNDLKVPCSLSIMRQPETIGKIHHGIFLSSF